MSFASYQSNMDETSLVACYLLPPPARIVPFVDKQGVGNAVKDFTQVKEHSICLFRFVQVSVNLEIRIRELSSS